MLIQKREMIVSWKQVCDAPGCELEVPHGGFFRTNCQPDRQAQPDFAGWMCITTVTAAGVVTEFVYCPKHNPAVSTAK